MEKRNIEERIMNFFGEKLEWIINCFSSTFYDSLNSFMRGFLLFKTIFFIKRVPNLPNGSE